MTQRKQKQGHQLVVGLGQTGLSCLRYLSAQGCRVAATDSRSEPPALATIAAELPEVTLFLGGFDAVCLDEVERVIVSPGVSLNEPLLQAAQARGLPIVGDVELFAQANQKPVLAVTGSNGKSTVVSLLGQMAAAAGVSAVVAGNIGLPVLDALQQSIQPDLYILELSSFQLETLHSLKPLGSCVLNVSADHMDRYADLTAYAAAKANVHQNSRCVVVNKDDALAASLTQMMPANTRQLAFSLSALAEGYSVIHEAGEAWLAKDAEGLMPVAELMLPGLHNQANALSALALGEAAGLAMPAMLKALREFPGLPHRTEFVAEADQVRWYNDSKGTNVGATVAALSGMPAAVVLIAGGQGKGADFTALADASSRVRKAILFGEDAAQIAQAFSGKVPMAQVTGLNEAVQLAKQTAQTGDSVLFSPACASFDMFSGYVARGEAFVAAVREVLA